MTSVCSQPNPSVTIYAHPVAVRAWAKLSQHHSLGSVVSGVEPCHVHREIMHRQQYSATGAFRKVLLQPIPNILSFVEREGKLVSYAMCIQTSSLLYGHTPERIGAHCFGIVGVWTEPAYRNLGFGKQAFSQLGDYLSQIDASKFYVLAEQRLLGMQGLTPLLMLPRWAHEQPSISALRLQLKQRKLVVV